MASIDMSLSHCTSASAEIKLYEKMLCQTVQFQPLQQQWTPNQSSDSLSFKIPNGPLNNVCLSHSLFIHFWLSHIYSVPSASVSGCHGTFILVLPYIFWTRQLKSRRLSLKNVNKTKRPGRNASSLPQQLVKWEYSRFTRTFTFSLLYDAYDTFDEWLAVLSTLLCCLSINHLSGLILFLQIWFTSKI